MTEKNYGGANSFGFKDSGLSAQKSIKNKGVGTKNHSGAVVKNPKENKIETTEDDFEGISSEDLKCYLKAGEISKKVKEYMKEIIKKGVPIIEVVDKIEDKIKEFGGEVAFPTNISIDEVAAHYTPTSRDTTLASGLFKVDIGVEVDGFIADTAVSFDLTDDKIHSEMIKLNNETLEAALKELKIGSPLKVIGNTIASFVEENGKGKYKVIRNLTGHGLDKDNLHAGEIVSNLRNENGLELRDIAIAIEPFLTEGKGEIFEGKPSEIYILQQNKLPRDRDARDMLNYILENFRTKPFCKRWIEGAGLSKPNYCLSVLVREGILYNFPILVEKERKPVSQAEHTVVFADKVYVTTK